MLISGKFPTGVRGPDCVIRIQRVTVHPGTLPTLALILPSQGPITDPAGDLPLSWRPPCLPSIHSQHLAQLLPASRCQPRRSRSESGGIGLSQAAEEEKGQGLVPRSGSRKVQVERCALAASLVPPSIQELRRSQPAPPCCPEGLPSLERFLM